MPNVPEHPTRDSAGRSHREVSQAAIEGAEAQPRLGRELQRPAEEIPDNVGVADDDLELVLRLRLIVLWCLRCVDLFDLGLRLLRRGCVGAVEILPERLLNARVLLVCPLYDVRSGLASWNMVARPDQAICEMSGACKENQFQARSHLPSLSSGSGSANSTASPPSRSSSPMFSYMMLAVSFARARSLTLTTRTRHGPNSLPAPRISSPSLLPVSSAWRLPRGVRRRFESSLWLSSYCPWRMRIMCRVTPFLRMYRSRCRDSVIPPSSP